MTGHVLIVHPLATYRIQLRAHLAPDAFDISLVSTAEAAIASVRAHVPDAIVVSDGLRDTDLASFFQAIKSIQGTRALQIFVVAEQDTPQCRLAALKAGADDVMCRSAASRDLRSRLRTRLQRLHQRHRAASLAGIDRHVPRTLPPSEVRITVVSARQPDPVWGLRQQFLECGLVKTKVVDAKTLLRMSRSETDVIVLVEDDAQHKAHDALCSVRGHPDLASVPVLFWSGPTSSDAQPQPLDLGADEAIPSHTSVEEVVLRATRLAHAKRADDQVDDALRELETIAFTDELTGLRNRSFIRRQLDAVDAEHPDNPTPYAVLMIDLDHFKAINDQHGHAAGDAVLRATAQTLSENLRKGDCIARFGGEEFLVLIRNADAETALCIANRLRQAVAASGVFWSAQVTLRVTLSCGVAVSDRRKPLATQTAITAADAALYRAKSTGRNRIAFAEATPRETRTEEIEPSLRRA